MRVEKTVFISYRRTNAPWALAIFRSLARNGFDVFFDFAGIVSGDFERAILENIRSRAHFLVLLTPSSLERCDEPGDWLRREIEEAMECRRNIVPLMLDSCDFGTPAIASRLTGKLETLKRYNGLSVPVEYFDAAMTKLREKFLDVPLDAVLHPVSAFAQQAVKEQQSAAATAPVVRDAELTEQQWFERGYGSADADEKLRCYSEVIRLRPDYADAYINRGGARKAKGQLDEALQDYCEAIRLAPGYADAYVGRGIAHFAKGDLEAAVQDFSEAIRLKPDHVMAYNNRGTAREAKGDQEGALQDYNEAIRLKPDHAHAHNNRGIAYQAKGDLEAALLDYSEAIRLKPDYADPYYNRGVVRKIMGDVQGAQPDFAMVERLKWKRDTSRKS